MHLDNLHRLILLLRVVNLDQVVSGAGDQEVARLAIIVNSAGFHQRHLTDALAEIKGQNFIFVGFDADLFIKFLGRQIMHPDVAKPVSACQEAAVL